ncbi:MAG: phosphate ABC transporter permease PstA [Bacillota bacterium]|jgi:phosphate transport system permease protein|nr:phosphate ABC transporter permease PstA [Bacillota bacterium]NLI59508.1 phosphate ABC transporter permease PstA [Clostridium sp.]
MVSKRKSSRTGPSALKLLVMLSAGLTLCALLCLLSYILIKGVPHLTPSLFAWEYNTGNVSLLPSLLNTVIITIIPLAVSVPLGVCSAIYLCEYAKPGSQVVALIRIANETLAGIPSIVYGLFGLLLFVTYLGWGYSILAGSMTLSLMILPLIMRTAEEALLTVPAGFREASLALGAGKLRTILRIVLPSAVPGIFSGVVLGIGRIAGETAALIYTAGTVPRLAAKLSASGRTLAIHLYTLSSEGLYTNEAYATAVVLVVIVLALNALSARIAKRFVKG